MSDRNRLVWLECGIKNLSGKGVLIIDNEKVETWLPRSQIKNKKLSIGDRVELVIPVWLAENKQLRYEDSPEDEEGTVIEEYRS